MLRLGSGSSLGRPGPLAKFGGNKSCGGAAPRVRGRHWFRGGGVMVCERRPPWQGTYGSKQLSPAIAGSSRTGYVRTYAADAACGCRRPAPRRATTAPPDAGPYPAAVAAAVSKVDHASRVSRSTTAPCHRGPAAPAALFANCGSPPRGRALPSGRFRLAGFTSVSPFPSKRPSLRTCRLAADRPKSLRTTNHSVILPFHRLCGKAPCLRGSASPTPGRC